MVQKLVGLTGDHFAHPLDRSGMQSLMNRLVKSDMTKNQFENLEARAEEEFYLLNLADNTRLSDSQGGSLYRLVREISEILSTPVPNVFLDTSPEINAYALGGTNPSIVLTSALIDTFPEPALRAVIAHELGHIICKHTFYRLLAENFDQLSKLISLIPFLGTFISMGLRWPLCDWYRKSELSADRAALLGTQDSGAIKDCILRLAGGSSRLAPELTISDFAAQSKEFQERMKAKREQGTQDKIGFLFSSFMLQHAMSTHPWPAVRLEEISRWAESKQYAFLLAGDYEKALQLAQSAEDEMILSPPPPGEDIKEYVKDLAKTGGSMLTGFLNRISVAGAKAQAEETLSADRALFSTAIDSWHKNFQLLEDSGFNKPEHPNYELYLRGQKLYQDTVALDNRARLLLENLQSLSNDTSDYEKATTEISNYTATKDSCAEMSQNWLNDLERLIDKKE